MAAIVGTVPAAAGELSPVDRVCDSAGGSDVEAEPQDGWTIELGGTYEFIPLHGVRHPAAPAGVPPLVTAGHLLSTGVKLPNLIVPGVGLHVRDGVLLTDGANLVGVVSDVMALYRWEFLPRTLALDLHAGPSVAVWVQDEANYLGPAADLDQWCAGGSLSAVSFGGVAGGDLVWLLGDRFRLTVGVDYRLTTQTSDWAINSYGSSRYRCYPRPRPPSQPQAMVYPQLGFNTLVIRGGLSGSF